MTLVLSGFGVSRGKRQIVMVSALEFLPGSNVLAGANGSGKTSLLSALAGLLPHSGVAKLNGKTVSLADVGYMPQQPGGAGHLTCLDSVMFARKVAGLPASGAQRYLTQVGLAELANEKVGRLSGGQQRLAYLAMVLSQEPGVLLLDEPTAGLDARHRLDVQDVILELARTKIVITATHLPGDLDRLAEHVVVISSGGVVFDGAGEQLRQRGNWDEVLSDFDRGFP